MVQCTIKLENEQNIICAGEILKGTIKLQLDSPIRMRGLYFILYGAAKCHWTETRKAVHMHTRTVHFEGKDVYLNSKTYLLGSSSGEATEIDSGLHTYEFACPLPQQIPASFETPNGSISYHIEVITDIPWKIDKGYKLRFKVVRRDDLNLQPDLKIPTKSEDFRQFCCYCLGSDSLFMAVALPFTGYVPGQSMKITVDYINKSNVEVTNTRFSLKRVIRYNSQTPERKARMEEKNLIVKFDAGVAAGKSRKFIKYISLPGDIASSNERYCSIVQIFHVLKVEAIAQGCHENIKIIIPITTGSIPLNFESFDTRQPIPYDQLQPAHTEENPPPSYEEAKWMHLFRLTICTIQAGQSN